MRAPDIDIPHGNEVTTEPQKQALESMSDDLVNKLNAMVAEQEQRARDFAAQQHSLSSLPSYNAPEVTAAPQPHTAATPTPPKPAYRAPRPAAARPPRQQAEPTPNLPNMPPPLPPQPRRTRSSWVEHLQHTVEQQVHTTYTEIGTPTIRPRKPTIIRDTRNKQQEDGISATTVGICIVVIFLLMLHGC